jgi:addiction module RelB/DinJ family antitoxin
MAATALVQARIDPELKARVEANLHKWGLDTTTAIRMFFAEIDLEQRIPFTVGNPSSQYMDEYDYEFAKHASEVEEHIKDPRNIVSFNNNNEALDYLGNLI